MGQKLITKRFIAGVVCPKCGEMDKIRMYRDEEETEIRDCVGCGFTETYKQHKEAKEAATTQSEPLYEERPLKIMNPGLNRKDH